MGVCGQSMERVESEKEVDRKEEMVHSFHTVTEVNLGHWCLSVVGPF